MLQDYYDVPGLTKNLIAIKYLPIYAILHVPIAIKLRYTYIVHTFLFTVDCDKPGNISI